MTIEAWFAICLPLAGALGALAYRLFAAGKWSQKVEGFAGELEKLHGDVTALKVSVEAIKLRDAEDGVLLRTMLENLANLTGKVDRLIERMGERP